MSNDDALRNLTEITEYFVQCHVNAAKHSATAWRFARYIIALDKARRADRLSWCREKSLRYRRCS